MPILAALLCGATLGLAAGAPAARPVPHPFEGPPATTAPTPLDHPVFARLERAGIERARPCSDPVFVRRVYLDVLGTLPTAHEAKTFILDRDPEKRRVLIDRVLARGEFADYWAMKWSELLRVKSEFPINLWPNAVQAYHRWIRTCLKENVPYDRFVRELLTASGSNFRVPPVNFYRAMPRKEPVEIARAVALTFMGTRADRWPSNQLAGLAAFFSLVGYKATGEWKEEIVFFDPALATNGLLSAARFPDGTPAALSAEQDPRVVLADWLTNPKNPWFARSLANRVWSWLLGRGIVHEPDDLRPDNPPSQPELLDLLERELIAARYDGKQLFRLVLNSQTYQLASVPRTDTTQAAALFASYPLRRLEAEVLIDALNQITGTTEKYTSAVPEPFTFIPDDQRSIALPDGSISSPFLDLFGRPPRDTGLESERNLRFTAAQRLHLLNSSHIQRKIEQSPMIKFQMQGGKTPREMVTGIYLGILSRFPTDHELRVATAYAQSSSSKTAKREAAVDLAWALINSAEFLYRH